MTLGEFNELSELDQIRAIWHRGVFLAERLDNLTRYVLYQLDAFYIEFTYNVVNNTQKQMLVFAGTGPLDPWLEDICIYF
ncbi:MAG: hypothetical protein JST39_00385 [Bacteroidetes bacterium]|nr:hypothetical protein [Bacteroidota bacterium]